MKTLRLLKRRLSTRTDSEHEQAVLRILLVGVITIYMWVRIGGLSDISASHDRILLVGLAGFFALALTIFAGICIWPAENVRRRFIGMLADAGGTTFALFLAGDAGVGLIGIYLFITFGNGFRYGRPYLFICQALCVLGFLPVLAFARWWVDEPYIGWGLLVSLIVLPLYVSTLLKRIQKERARAEEANRAKSVFLANMSHEMRTPLNGIVGVTDLLNSTHLDREQSELVRLLRHSVTLLRSLVDDVLDLSKIEAGRLTIELIEFDLYATINGIIKMMKPHATGKRLNLRAAVDPAIEYNVKGDPHHLRQVLVNLLSNAIKFTERGNIELHAKLCGQTADGLRVRFEIRDTGIGIPVEAQTRIFEQFVQADSSTTRKYGGTGLGTAIAKQLVQLMGGCIGLESKVNEGSTFWFEIPLLRVFDCEAPGHRSLEYENRKSAVLFAAGQHAQRATRLVQSTYDPCICVDNPGAAIEALGEYWRKYGQSSPLIACCDAEIAVELFDRVRREPHGEPPLVLLSDTALSADQRQRIDRLEGAVVLGVGSTPRLLRNAVHAATAAERCQTAEIIDLRAILQQQQDQQRQREALRILVAEDNPTNQAIIRQLLEKAGHDVIVASNGEQALDCYETQNPDLAILDFNMPERSGVEVSAAIRAIEGVGERLPIIILSASVTPDTLRRAENAGADKFIGKPFDGATLLSIIDGIARKTKQYASANTSQAASISFAAIPLVDQARVKQLMVISPDPDFLSRLVEGFASDVSSLLERFRSAILEGDVVAVRDIAHAMKGGSLGIGASQFAARCDAIECGKTSSDVAALHSLSAELRICIDSTMALLRNQIQTESRRASR